MKRKILQLANWDLKNVINNLDYVKEANFTSVQISPVQECKPLWLDGGRIQKYSYAWYNQINKEFWKFYQPLSFNIGNELGTFDEYKQLCEEAHKKGLEIIVDVVLRHLAQNDLGQCVPHELCDKSITSRPEFFMNDGRKADNFSDRQAMVRGVLGNLPTLNYNNEELQQRYYLPFLNTILKYGDGIRIDMCHSLGLESDGCNFFPNVIGKLRKDAYISGECVNAWAWFDQYARWLVPILKVEQCWDAKFYGQYYFECHDDVLSFLKNLSATKENRLRDWETVLRRNGDALFFARQCDNVIFSPEMKELNNRYR